MAKIRAVNDHVPGNFKLNVTWLPDFDFAVEALAPISTLITGIEGDLVCLPELCEKLLAFEKVSRESQNEFARMICNLVLKRFENTADGALAMAAFVFTRRGWVWIRARMKSAIAIYETAPQLCPSDEQLAFATEVSNQVDKIRACVMDLVPRFSPMDPNLWRRISSGNDRRS
jgi:hypothetical protein